MRGMSLDIAAVGRRKIAKRNGSTRAFLVNGPGCSCDGCHHFDGAMSVLWVFEWAKTKPRAFKRQGHAGAHRPRGGRSKGGRCVGPKLFETLEWRQRGGLLAWRRGVGGSGAGQRRRLGLRDALGRPWFRMRRATRDHATSEQRKPRR